MKTLNDEILNRAATSAKPDQEGDAIHNLREAVYAVLSNEDHAFSGGMRSYQKGSQTWQVYEDLRIAAIASKVQTTDDIHSCSFFCELPACIKTQRDLLRDQITKAAK